MMETTKKQNDLLTRDYDLNSIEEDPRFQKCFREFITIVALCVVAIVVLGFTVYGIDWGNVAEYKYILGLPAWVTVTGLVQLILIVIVSVFANKLIREDSLDDVIE